MSERERHGSRLIVIIAAGVCIAAWAALAPQTAHGAEACTPEACELPMLEPVEQLPATGVLLDAVIVSGAAAVVLGTLLLLAAIAYRRPRYRRAGARR